MLHDLTIACPKWSSGQWTKTRRVATELTPMAAIRCTFSVPVWKDLRRTRYFELADLFQSRIERERHRRAELNQRKIPMIGVEQIIAFMGNNRGRNRQACALASKSPFRSNDPRIVHRNRSVPSLWQGAEFDGLHRKGQRNLDFYQNHSSRKRPTVRQHFQSAQRCALGAINDTDAGRFHRPP